VVASTSGVDHIRFYKDGGFKSKWFRNYEERFDSILVPACALAGCEYSIGPKEGEVFSNQAGAVARMKEIKKLKGVLPVERGDYITVTLRNTGKEYRNSSKSWKRFIEEKKPVVIPDYADQKIHLHERMRLYEGAKMNFLVSNGPATLVYFSEAPYAVLKIVSSGSASKEYLEKQGMPEGFQWKFRGKNQKMFWMDDTYENINKAYEEMCVFS
jgi:hypothetical protein